MVGNPSLTGLGKGCPLLGRNSMRLQSACGCVTSTSIRLPPRRESLAPPDGSGIHDLATLCSSQSPQSRILWAEYACGIIFPNPGMDQPLSLSDEVTSLFAALALTQSVRVFQMRQYADIFMAVPDCQRFWKWRVQWLAVRPFGRIPQITHAGQRVF